jgi:hypothetical protein
MMNWKQTRTSPHPPQDSSQQVVEVRQEYLSKKNLFLSRDSNTGPPLYFEQC